MWRYLAGGGAGMAAVAAAFLMAGRASPPHNPLPEAPQSPSPQAAAADPLPADAPEATPRTREEKRFNRYDKDRDGAITRDEYLANRRKAYARLDVNGDGQLSFDEWAAKTTAKFAAADRDKSGAMTASEFATTAVKRSDRTRANCPPAPRREDDS